MPNSAQNFKFEYFKRGGDYSSTSESKRFATVDYNMKSYVGVIGVGVISGWTIQQTTDREIEILPGRGVINGFLSESPYTIKRRSEMINGDRETEVVKLQVAPEADMTDAEADAYILVVQQYDPTFDPTKPIEDAYVKIVIPEVKTLSNNADTYVWVTRKYSNFYPALADYPPHTILEPSMGDYDTFDDYVVVKVAYDAQMQAIYDYEFRDSEDNHFTEVTFNYADSFVPSSTKVLLGVVTTRDNEVTKIDTTGVQTLKNLESTIVNYANKIVAQHQHGGDKEFDPARINLETDIRQAFLTSYSSEDRTGTFSVVESQFTDTKEGHKHSFVIDADGNGQTVGIIGSSNTHYHKIIDSIVQTQEFTNETINDHIHVLPDISNFSWTDDSEYIVYVNGISVGDDTSSNITSSPSRKVISLTGIIGGVTRTYGIDHTFDGGQFSFTKQKSGVYLFMLDAIKEFNIQFPDTPIEQHPFVFFDAETNIVSGVSDLRDQSITAEALLEETGDKFVFTPDAAKNVEVTLTQYQKTVGLESDRVTVEILGNSEVSGVLRIENILFINAEKITTGVFEISQIPFLSHVGRMGETCISSQYPSISKNGFEFLVTPATTTETLGHRHNLLVNDKNTGLTEHTYTDDEPVLYESDSEGNSHLIAHIHSVQNGTIQSAESSGLLSWQNSIEEISDSSHVHEIINPVVGNAKTIYSISEDRFNNVYLGTSDGLIMFPNDDSYIFVINDMPFYETGTDLLSMFEKAKVNYENKTGTPLRIKSDLYTSQIAIAESEILNVGDSYLIVGKSESNSTSDKTMIQKLSYIPVPNYKSSSFKEFDEIGDNDTITRIELVDATSGEILDPNSSTVQESAAEDPSSVKKVARVDQYLDLIPVVSINIQETTVNGVTNDNVLTVGGNLLATNKNLYDNFYFNWQSPNTPSGAGVFRNAEQDEEGSIWVASNDGVLVLRSHNESTILSKTSMPGLSLDIKDIAVLSSDNVFCAVTDGIYKTIDQGKTWSKKLDGDFYQIIKDLGHIIVANNYDHIHQTDININGNGTLLLNGHTHTVTNWTSDTYDEHNHAITFHLYAKSDDSVYRSNDSGETWKNIAALPDGETGKIFAFNREIYLSRPSGLYRYSNGWEQVNEIVPYSFQFSYDLSTFYVVTVNELYISDGNTYTLTESFSGNPTSTVKFNGTVKNFGHSYNNRGKTFYFDSSIITEDTVSTQVDFLKWSTGGGWDEAVPYDIFIDDDLILSTKSGVDNKELRGWMFEVDSNVGEIDFSAETSLTEDLEVFDNYISVEDSSKFQVGDSILIKGIISSSTYESSSSLTDGAEELIQSSNALRELDESYLYTDVSATSSGLIHFSPKSTIKIKSSAKVYKIPNLDSNSEIKINIYDSFLSNIGTNTHEELEDKLSYESDQRPYGLNNAYLSNLLQLTQAVIYAKPGIDSSMIQSQFYDFHYSDSESDDNYYGNYIDISNSEAYSLVQFQNKINPRQAFAINKILVGSGSFAGNVIVATDIGVFWSILSGNLNANWFYVWDLNKPVYDLIIFGEENLLATTNDGVYITTDMLNWTLETQEAIQFPTTSISLRWPKDNFTVIASHTASFENVGDDPERGRIGASGNIYSDILENKSIKVEILSDDTNVKNNTSYLITKVYPNSLQVSPPFEGGTETLTEVKLTIGSWWQQFSGENHSVNSGLNNTVLVGGENKIAYTPYIDGFIWTTGIFSDNIKDVNVTKFLPLSTGGILANASGTDLSNVANYILRSSDMGKVWDTYNKFEEIRGKITAFKLTSLSHSQITINYTYPNDFRYANGEFDKRNISIFLEDGLTPIFSGKVIYNDGPTSTVTIFGREANEIISSNKDSTLNIEIYPITISDMIEANDKKILFGTDVGIYEDNNTTTGEFPFDGQVWSVGSQGTITSIDKSGTIKSVKENPVSNNVVASISTSESISANQFQNLKMYVMDTFSTQEYTVVENSSRSIGGEISVEIDLTFSTDWELNVGKKATLVEANSSINVNFDLLVLNNELSGGTLTLSSDENGNLGTVYNIVSNTANKVVVDQSIIPYNFSNPDTSNKDSIPGQSFVCLDSSGKVPVNVVFTKNVIDNFLVDFNFEISNEAISDSSSISIYSNSRNTVYLNDFTSSTGDTPIALSIKPNDLFRASGKIYQPLASFNNKKTSVDSNHYHKLDLIGEFMNGDIDSFVSTVDSVVEFAVSNSNIFSSTIVQKDGTLFSEARIRFYNPQQVGIEYFSEVISHDSSNIKVKLLNSTNWNFTEYSQTKISSTWKWEVDATLYGYTNSTIYEDFITDSQIITSDVSLSDSTITVESTANMVSGDKISISTSEKSEINFIDTVIDLTTIGLANVASNSYLVKNNPQVKVLRDNFANIHEHMVRENQVQTISIDDYLDKGLPPQHSHRNHALINSIADLKQDNNNIFAVGSSSFVYNSTNDGKGWSKIADLNVFVEDHLEIDGIASIETISGTIIAGTTNGEIFSTSDGGVEILPLNQPTVN